MELILWWDIFTENGTCIIIISYLEDLEYILYTLYICAAVYNCDIVSWIDVCVCVLSISGVSTDALISAGSADTVDGQRCQRHVLTGTGGGGHLQSGPATHSGQSQQSQLHKANGNGNITLIKDQDSFFHHQYISFNITGIILSDSRSIASSPL